MERRRLVGRKLLVATVGVATVSYAFVACGGEVVQDPNTSNGLPDGNRFDVGQPFRGDGGNVDALQPMGPDGNRFGDVFIVQPDAAEASTDAGDEG